MKLSTRIVVAASSVTIIAAVAAMAGLATRSPDRAGAQGRGMSANAADLKPGRPGGRGTGGHATSGVPGAPQSLLRVVGGQLGPPFAADSRVYVPLGRTLAVWDYGNPAAPRRYASPAPAPGVIQSVTRGGRYLYASWREGDCRRGGVAVYDASNPWRPRLVRVIDDYAQDVFMTCTAGIAVAKGRLYLADTENGLYVGDLSDPREPVFQRSQVGFGVATRIAAAGDQLWLSGSGFVGGAQIRAIDISVPDVPVETASYASPDTSIFDVTFQAPYAYGFGHAMSVLDLSSPQQIALVGQAEMPYGATTGLRIGDHVFSGGFHGLDVWSVQAPEQPTFLANHPLRTFSAIHSLPLARPGFGLMLGTDDRMLALDGRIPAQPALASTRVQAGGVNAVDAVRMGEFTLLLQAEYGLTVADPDTLVPLARFEADLPDDPQARAFEGMAIAGDIAYLAAWGYGLIVVDLSDPLQPLEIGRLPYPFASSVEVEGDRLYLGKNTNGPALAVVDIADPAQPQLLADWSMPDAPWDMVVEGNLLFAAERGTFELAGGVRVLDVSDPLDIVQLARWDGDCDSVGSLSLDAARDRLYLACRSGLRILDVSNPAAPALLGGANADGYSTFAAVAVRGDRAWYGSGLGLEEFDVTVPSAPQSLRQTDLAGYEPITLRPTPTGGLLATTRSAGVHIFAPGE